MFLINGIILMVSLDKIDGFWGVLYIILWCITLILITMLYWVRRKTSWYKIALPFLFGALFAALLIGWILSYS